MIRRTRYHAISSTLGLFAAALLTVLALPFVATAVHLWSWSGPRRLARRARRGELHRPALAKFS